MRVTAEQVRQKRPCRSPEVYLEGRPEATLLQILDFTDVPVFDRIWLVTRFTTSDQNREFAVHCAEAIKKEYNVRNADLTAAIKLAKQYVDTAIFQIDPPDPETEEMKSKLAAIARGNDHFEVLIAKMLRRALMPDCQFFAVENPVIYAQIEKLKDIVFDVETDLPVQS